MAYDKPALDAHIADDTRHLTTNQNDAIDNANSPSASNPLATITDITNAGHVNYAGTWDASGASAPSATPKQGEYWIVTVAGSFSLDGITDWEIGDWAIYNDATQSWEKIDNTQASVAANQVAYDNSTSGLTAIDVQAAIDELENEIDAIPAGSDINAKVSANDTTTGFIGEKVVGTAAEIVATETNDGGNETLVLSLGSDAMKRSVYDTDLDGIVDDSEKLGNQLPAYYLDADNHAYDNTTSGLTATNVQAAIDEIDNTIDNLPDSDINAKVSVNDTTTGFIADKVVGTANEIIATETNDGGNETLVLSAGSDLMKRSVYDTDLDGIVDDADKLDGQQGTYYLDADNHVYSNTVSGLLATDTQAAIDEIDSRVDALEIAPPAHASSHLSGGTDELDGDKVDIDFNPTNYTPTTTPPEVSSLDELSAHLAGIDVALTTAGVDEKVAVSGTDTTPGYLQDEVTGTTNKIVVSVTGIGDEKLNVNIGSDVFDKTVDDAGDVSYSNTTSGLTATDVQAAIDELDSAIDSLPAGSDESVKVSANDTTAGYLKDKVLGTATEIVATETNDGLNETLVLSLGSDVMKRSVYDADLDGIVDDSEKLGNQLPAYYLDADNQVYSNTVSGLTATDTQAAIDELDSRIDNLTGGVKYVGTWDASSASPPSATPAQGEYWKVSVAGSFSLDGITDWKVGDVAIYNDAIQSWEKWDNTEKVVSVNGQDGAVVLDTDDVSEGTTNKYNIDHTGDVTSIGAAATISANAVDNTKSADMPALTLKGNDTGVSADPQDLTVAEVQTLLNVEDGANNYSHPNHTGDVTSVSDGATTITADAVDNTKLNNMPALTLKGNDTGISADPQDLTVAEVQTLLNVEDGANNYSHPNHTGDVTSVSDGATTIVANAVDNTKSADMPALTLKGNDTGVSADPQDLTVAEVQTLLNVEDGAELNTASNVGVGGVGVFDAKVGSDLQFKNINAASNKVSVADDVANNEIDIDIVEANINVEDFSTANNDTTLALSPDGAGGLVFAPRGTGLNVKAGNVLSGSFTGNPKSYTVTFSTAYPNANYSINLQDISSSSSYKMTVSSKTASGFTMTTNTGSVSNLDSVDWHTIAFGEE